MANVGGVIINHKGNEKSKFEWGLGGMTNNYIEIHVFFLCISILISKTIKFTLNFGDSSLIIGLVRRIQQENDKILGHMIQEFLLELSQKKIFNEEPFTDDYKHVKMNNYYCAYLNKIN